jgi:hypothetical protein
VDVRLDDIVLRALEKEPERRYQTALQVKTDVESISSAPPPAPSPAPGAVLAGAAASAAAKSRGSRKGVIIALVVSAAAFTILVAVALVVTVLFVTRSRREHALAQARLRTEGQISNLQSVLKETARQSPAPAAAPARELSAVEFTGLVADLKSPNAVRRRIALSRLATVKPVEPREDVVKELIAALDDTEWGTRGSAARALGVWGTAAAVEPLIKSLEDPEFTVRWAAINSLAQLKSPEAAVPVARVLARGGTDALQAEQALKALGPPAEEPVIGLLGARDNDTRRHACRILQEIGTAKSIPALTAAASDADGITAMLAKAALEAIASQKRREIYFRSRSGNVSVETAQPETNKIQP